MGVICLFVLDPGQSSGVARGRFWEEGSVEARIQSRSHYKSMTFTGNDLKQVREIWREWQNFRLECMHAGLLEIEFIIEDFILTRMSSTKREGISPVRITAMLEGYRHGLADGYEAAGFGPAKVIEPIFQQPGQAFTYVTDERLKRWGLWLPGKSKEHEREAAAHLCLRLAERAKRIG